MQKSIARNSFGILLDLLSTRLQGGFIFTDNTDSQTNEKYERITARFCKGATFLDVGAEGASSLDLSDAKIYEPYMRAHLETTARFCEAVALKLTGVFGVQGFL